MTSTLVAGILMFGSAIFMHLLAVEGVIQSPYPSWLEWSWSILLIWGGVLVINGIQPEVND